MGLNTALKPEERLMNLDERLLEKLAEWRPDSGRQTLVVAEPTINATVTVTADRTDVVGAQLWEVTLDRPAALDVAGLKAWADKTAARVTGLLEPLRVLEIDGERSTALLRSQAPTQRGDSRFYYEVLLNGKGRAQVARYQASAKPDGQRRQINFGLTHETLAKLVSDINASL
jgi:hypothetical protein